MKQNKHLFILLVLSIFSGMLAVCVEDAYARPINMTVDSSQIDPFSLTKKPEPDERLEFYRDGEMVSYNENGEPNIGRRF